MNDVFYNSVKLDTWGSQARLPPLAQHLQTLQICQSGPVLPQDRHVVMQRARLIIDSTIWRSWLYLFGVISSALLSNRSQVHPVVFAFVSTESQILERVFSLAGRASYRALLFPPVNRLLSLLSVKRADLLAQIVEWAVGDMAGLRSERRVESRDEKSSGSVSSREKGEVYQTEMPSLTCKRQWDISYKPCGN